ncbi:thiamine biosynthesis protein ThiS [Bordetella sp. J329]|jgi:sulfur carrier protein|uniref:sulfur carrier protein ThiS n=1 Tax=Kerstersia gyiorum TaxID=206506 RepID=UPI000FDB0E07|nr:sulfur carrier protein ThiS [Kerstersia gyiorum]AZV92612.1 thiamine biosynthesis protein ThiS [Bordetella sp. J329]MCH4271897.1 sulfur carrier protein ThiS [Kerstersia gyiorum]MCI1229431.1 sulfur carrier protein ThiS [Kerstersia gyiorum]QBR39570.1 sulfur carrier protein ThiS [Kerstersia gyiorum]
MRITLNGEDRTFDSALSVTGLLEALGHTGKRVAVERNGEIVPKSLHSQTQLTEGDIVELVVAVGGG